ncbi:MAG: DUF1902 domain-containing protein [Selenomonadaceae bacterium]|nr:DUF1902 domain-containing protein [Selenomonadaceae bacterium]
MEGYNVKLSWDDEAKVWLANCEEIPLAMEDGSLDKLIYRVKIAASELIELNNLPKYDSIFMNLTQREKMVYSNS